MSNLTAAKGDGLLLGRWGVWRPPRPSGADQCHLWHVRRHRPPSRSCSFYGFNHGAALPQSICLIDPSGRGCGQLGEQRFYRLQVRTLHAECLFGQLACFAVARDPNHEPLDLRHIVPLMAMQLLQ